MERSERRAAAGHTLVELMVSLSISLIFLGTLVSTWRYFSEVLAAQNEVSTFQAGYRAAIHQIARDLRAAGANPTTNPYLFDQDPPTDTGIDLDPDHDGDRTNAVLVRMDVKGGEGSFSDGDASDLLEIVYYHYLPEEAVLFRHTWRVDPVDAQLIEDEHKPGIDQQLLDEGVVWTEMSWHDEMFLADVCDFSFTFFDREGKVTDDPGQVLLVSISLVAASAPGSCGEPGEFSRPVSTVVRLRNR